jgi:hypothetical protein
VIRPSKAQIVRLARRIVSSLIRLGQVVAVVTAFHLAFLQLQILVERMRQPGDRDHQHDHDHRAGDIAFAAFAGRFFGLGHRESLDGLETVLPSTGMIGASADYGGVIFDTLPAA